MTGDHSVAEIRTVLEDVCDVLIVGSGAAGLTAAIAARDFGADSVVVVEGGTHVGGNSRLASGVIMGSGSRMQAASGSAESPEALLRDYLTWNQHNVARGPVSAMIERSGATIDWLQDLGVPFEKDLIRCLIEPQPRGHCVQGGGQKLVDVLTSVCHAIGVEFVLGQPVRRLIAQNGAVKGVATTTEEIPARAVVLTTGGFGADDAKVREYFPSAWVEGWSWYIGSDEARGDAIELCRSVGAQLAGADTGLRTLIPDFSPQRAALEPLMPGWSVLLDESGRRFIDESMPYGVLDARVRSVGDHAFLLFDDRALTPPDAEADEYRYAYRARWPHRPPFHPINWVRDVVDEMVAAGRIRRAGSLGELASRLNLDPYRVEHEIQRYNKLAERCGDEDQGKPAAFLKPLMTAPFYGAELRPACVNETGFGPRVDRSARVLGEDGKVIDGLLAAGECTGGMLGRAYMGSGTSLMNACTMGRLAGETASRSLVAPACD